MRLITDSDEHYPIDAYDFFPNSASAWPRMSDRLKSRLWFEAGRDGGLELRFACRPQMAEYLCFVMGSGYLLFRQVDIILSRSVFVAIGWFEELPSVPHQSIVWLGAGGPLPEAPQAADEGGFSDV